MPFQIIRNDLTNVVADAIVNSANPRPVVGAGTDAMIHAKAGPELLQARQKIGFIAPGQAAVTKAYGLHARYVIHTVGPVWVDGTRDEERLLRSCYDNALALAAKHRCRSVAFPLISTGNYGFPKDKALKIAIAAFSDFLLENDMQITLVVFHREAYRLSEQLFEGVRSYIDEHYVQQWKKAVYESGNVEYRNRRMADAEFLPPPVCAAPAKASAPRKKPAFSLSLSDFIKTKDAGFTQTLLSLIKKKGLKNADVYKRANISKQHFSKLLNDSNAKPSKQTAIALALALELNLEETKDLIGRAGYALTNSSTFDLIIRYFIENGQYNVVEINIALYEFDQTLLGS